jgi:xyloglucan-specific exo-beta-1,4-glucanase
VLFDPSSGKPGEPTQLIYAGVSRFEDNLYRSKNAGESWELVPEQPKGFMPSRAAVDRDGTLYVSYGNDPGPFAVQDGALHRFEPKREVWTNISPIQPSKSDGFGYGAVTVDPSHPGTVLATTIDRWAKGGEIFRSRDSGKTWQPLLAKATLDAAGVAHVYHHKDKLGTPQWMGDIKIDPFAPDHAATIEGGGVWITEDLTRADQGEPTRWTYRTKNLEETGARGIISPPEGAPLLSVLADLCGFRHDSLEESPKHGNFQNPTCASGDAIDFAGKSPRVVARVGNAPWDPSGKLPRGAVSTDGGRTWTQFRSEPAGSSGSGSVTVSADGATILWAAKDAIAARSLDRGATWTVARGLPPPAKVADWAPASVRVAADRVNPQKFYVIDLIGGKGYVSEDGGESFELTTGALTALPDYNLVVGSIQTVPGFEGHVWITGGKELLRSVDSGKSYSAVPNVSEAYAVGFGHPAPGQEYPAIYLSGKVGAASGFFRSDDGGASFARINDDAHQYGGTNLIIGDPRVYGRAYIAPAGRGILYGEPK